MNLPREYFISTVSWEQTCAVARDAMAAGLLVQLGSQETYFGMVGRAAAEYEDEPAVKDIAEKHGARYDGASTTFVPGMGM